MTSRVEDYCENNKNLREQQINFGIENFTTLMNYSSYEKKKLLKIFEDHPQKLESLLPKKSRHLSI